MSAFESGTGEGDAGMGDIFPSLVTADDARAYIGETDAQWKRLDQDVRASAATTDETLRRSFATDYVGWLTFRDDAIEHVGFLNAKATMDQTDRWAAKVAPWRAAIQQAGGKVSGPGPIVPGQGVPGDSPSANMVTWLVAGALVVAGVFSVGYVLRSIPRFPRLPGSRSVEKALV